MIIAQYKATFNSIAQIKKFPEYSEDEAIAVQHYNSCENIKKLLAVWKFPRLGNLFIVQTFNYGFKMLFQFLNKQISVFDLFNKRRSFDTPNIN